MKFYCFPTSNSNYPHKVRRREEWLKAVRLKNSDGSPWVPGMQSRICSQHFVGNAKSDDPRSPSYIPSIFPDIYKKRERNTEADLARYQRALRRIENKENITSKKRKSSEMSACDEVADVVSSSLHNNISECNENISNDSTGEQSNIEKHDASCQVNIYQENQAQEVVIISNRFIYLDKSEVETQINGPIIPEKKVIIPNLSSETENHEKNVLIGFKGFDGIKTDEELIELAGVTLNVFKLLLKILTRDVDDSYRKISYENRLLIFLMKMKLGLSFGALRSIFHVHRSTISRIFYDTLTYMAVACKNFVFWPEKEVVEMTMPECFKAEFENTRVTIDATEFQVEQPCSIDQRVQFYSHYKKGFRVKVIIGCAPNGMISFVSKCFGGRASDPQITVASEFLEKLEPGDIVLADKGFPTIKTILDEQGKDVLVVLPPFKSDGKFSAEQVDETYHVASVRIHIERIMQRIRTFAIVDKLTIELLPYCDDIMFMCAVLVNLQPPIIKTE